MEKNTEIGISNNVENYSYVRELAPQRLYFLSKRLLDIIVSAVVLLVTSPVLAVVALLVHFDSSGPVFFVQKRIGGKRKIIDGTVVWEKNEFSCIKFRTMISNADSSPHQEYIRALIENDEKKLATIQHGETKVKKLVNDPRITHIGSFLRKSSLDELPQFWNVLKGDMSLVGPRPAIPYEVAMYKPWYNRRLRAIPGITGLWQVTARSSVDFDDMVRLDIQYIERQSFWLDLWILIRTPLVVIMQHGAV